MYIEGLVYFFIYKNIKFIFIKYLLNLHLLNIYKIHILNLFRNALNL